MMNKKVKSGFTLMELMVYIALLGGIVLIAGQAFSDSSKMRVRMQSMLQANQTVGNVATIIKQDIAQLGAKSSKEVPDPTNPTLIDNFSTVHVHDVYIDPDNAVDSLKDSSSYKILKKRGEDIGDTIVMRRLRYKSDGDSAGSYEAVEEVKWFVDEERVLVRTCKGISGKSVEECPCSRAGCSDHNADWGDSSVIAMADGVSAFRLTAGTPSVLDSLVVVLPDSLHPSNNNFKLVSRFGEDHYEPTNVDPLDGGESVKLSGFYMNYDLSESNPGPISNPDLIKANQVFLAPEGASNHSWRAQCISVNLVPFIEYEISFSMPVVSTEVDPSSMFCPGRDHMAVGFRFAGATNVGKKPDGLNDFQFYPPTVGDDGDTGFRKMRFTTNDTIKDVCLGFSIALFSPVASAGNINISNLKLKKVPTSNYKFTADACNLTPSGACAANSPCCAPKVKKNVKALKVEFTIAKNGEAGAETAIIPIPSNGPRD